MKYMLSMSILSALLLLWDIIYSLKKHSEKFITKRKEKNQRHKSMKHEKSTPTTNSFAVGMDFNLDQLSPIEDEKLLEN